MNALRSAAGEAQNKGQTAVIALFVSDLHLQPSLPATTRAFFSFLHRHAAHARQLYLLGDIFEYWAGDDDLDSPYAQEVTTELRRLSDSGVNVFWIAGNRDFLAGEQFAERAGLTLLPDPCVIIVAGQRIALTHGDAHCTDDQAYMAFRAQVRSPDWQKDFLSRPLEQRKKIIEELRAGSREAQRGKPIEIMDLNAQAIANLFKSTGTSLMIHGHTHRPAFHETQIEGKPHLRYVLPDWDCDSLSPRGGWITIDGYGDIHRHSVDGVEVR